MLVQWLELVRELELALKAEEMLEFGIALLKEAADTAAVVAVVAAHIVSEIRLGIAVEIVAETPRGIAEAPLPAA